MNEFKKFYVDFIPSVVDIDDTSVIDYAINRTQKAIKKRITKAESSNTRILENLHILSLKTIFSKNGIYSVTSSGSFISDNYITFHIFYRGKKLYDVEISRK